ncbi:MAG: isoprenylcysteine carboxylmethyltransferase family protein [Thermoflexales bacterium]|nr:isoprenylcysteine carboxylmethyltransferase family protein [Thermoflexales bacterium]MDW8350664.1 isoprenylcysteine carboxylmethyltransferase family protein [Anaerolineae bacterium]
MTLDAYFIGPDGVFPSPTVAALFLLMQLGFMATESRRRRKGDVRAVRVVGLFPPLWLALLIGLTARLTCGFLKIGVIRGEVRDPIVWGGVLMVALGWGMRLWSQRALGRYFIGEVAVQPGQIVVRDGPYRWVRHPAYAGGLLSSIGFALMLSTWLGALISAAMLVWAYAVRVPREEALLAQELGDAYRDYMARTKRFVPFVF